MAQVIKIKNGTGTSEPTSLKNGELAINVDSGIMFHGSGSGDVVKKLQSFATITASGDISSSGLVSGKSGSFEKLMLSSGGDTTDFLMAQNQNSVQLKMNNIVNTEFTHNSTQFSQPITASGDVSASGNIYSDNEEVIFYSFQLNNSATAGSWYGANSQGPNYYYWNKEYTGYPNVGLSHFNSGHVLSHKSELVSFRFVIHSLSSGVNSTATGSVLVLSADDFSYPLTSGTTVNNNLRTFTPATVSNIDTQYASYELSNGAISGSFPQGTMIYPRFNVSDGGNNWRGFFELRYKRIK